MDKLQRINEYKEKFKNSPAKLKALGVIEAKLGVVEEVVDEVVESVVEETVLEEPVDEVEEVEEA